MATSDFSKGFDNPTATQDDDSHVKPDLVIRVQPQMQEGNSRAALPVTTVDWQSTPRGQFIPVHGLDFLIGVNSLLIKQTVEINELTSKIESENRYIVKVPQGEALFIASEVSTSTQRSLCGSGRAFLMHLHDNTRQEALQFKRRLAAASCCFPCRLQELQVITPPGDYVGRIQQQWTWIVPFYLVRDACDAVLFVIEGPTSFKKSALMESEFKIMSGDSLRVVGRIIHGWDRELVSFTTTLHIPVTAVQPKHKALLLGAAFLMSIETCSGGFFRDTMHGVGEYRWRYLGPEGSFFTYEGYFYSNRMHGYGVMSYDDGRTFKGLYYKDVRWGPGVQSHVYLEEDVGLWRGTQLVRLAWMPQLSPVPDLNSHPEGKKTIEPSRVVLTTTSKTIGEINSAVDLLKHFGAEPMMASNKWPELYAKSCTDQESALCHREAFENSYYGNKIRFLEERDNSKDEGSSTMSPKGKNILVSEDGIKYFAWNNNNMTKQMMNHCFMHDYQRESVQLNLAHILSGQRNQFKPAGEYEQHCRNFLMACFVGNVHSVTNFVVNTKIFPNIADVQGNTALMYAIAGDNESLVHFLLEAGAQVNDCNDACVTPLGMAIINYLAVLRGIPHGKLVEALISPPLEPTVSKTSAHKETVVTEWNMTRALTSTANIAGIKHDRPQSIKKTRSTIKKSKLSASRHSKIPMVSKTDVASRSSGNNPIANQYHSKIVDMYMTKDLAMVSIKLPYLFQVSNIVKDVKVADDNVKSVSTATTAKKQSVSVSKKKSISKIKASRETFSYMSLSQRDLNSDSEATRILQLERIMSIIQELLTYGADPRLVMIPQPALVMALSTENTQLIEMLIHYGLQVNVTYPQFFGFTPLDIMVTRPLIQETFNVVKTLLQNGATVNHRLPPKDPEGPTLLHALLSRRPENENQENICREIIQLLLNYGCDATAFYNKRAALDVAMSKSSFLNVFVQNPKVNLNATINDSNQTVLIKLFNPQYFKEVEPTLRQDILKNFLLYGADPLMICSNGNLTYSNLFVYMKEIYDKMAPKIEKPNSAEKQEKSKKSDKKKGDKVKGDKTKSDAKHAKLLKNAKNDDAVEYKLAIDLVTDCTRILHTRWIQSTLMKQLLEIIWKHKTRAWHLIMNDHKNKKNARLWLTPQRCLHIWNILKSTKKAIYDDKRILWSLMCIIQYYNKRPKLSVKLTFQEKEKIESEISQLLREHKQGIMEPEELCYQSHVKPELHGKAARFIVCFDCYMPLPMDSIQCTSCKLVSFCNMTCMKENCNKVQGHPCSEYLLQKYFPSPRSET